MNRTIENELRNHYVESTYHTHVSMVQPKGKFQFNRHDQEIFWDVYNKTIENNPDIIVGIAEKPNNGSYLPVLVDVDLKRKDEDDEDDDRLYTIEHVIEVIKIYQTVLRLIVNDCQDNN